MRSLPEHLNAAHWHPSWHPSYNEAVGPIGRESLFTFSTITYKVIFTSADQLTDCPLQGVGYSKSNRGYNTYQVKVLGR
jgi:hypothetical protein